MSTKHKSKKNKRRNTYATGDTWQFMARETGDAIVDMMGGKALSEWWQTYRDNRSYAYKAVIHMRKLQGQLRAGTLDTIEKKNLPLFGARNEQQN